jgi:glycine cleavage system regulatory protein
MKSRMILSAIGNDRPGLTQALADAVLSAGGNWLESHLSHLGGQFVGAVLVELEAARIGELEAAVQAVDERGLHVTVVPAGDTAAQAGGDVVRIDLVGQDRPGIVREVTAALAPLGANIEDFVSVTENGAWSGEQLFRATAKVTLPAGTSLARVQEALEAISAEIIADLTFSKAKAR